MKKIKKKYKSEEEVKEALAITDFGSISKEKVSEFLSLLPKIDKDVAMSIVNQFPNYVDIAKEMVSGLMKLTEKALDSVDAGNKEVIKSYQVVLEALNKQLDKGDLTKEESKEIYDKMIMIAESIDAANEKHSFVVKDILKGIGNTVLGVAVVGVAIIVALGGTGNKK